MKVLLLVLALCAITTQAGWFGIIKGDEFTPGPICKPTCSFDLAGDIQCSTCSCTGGRACETTVSTRTEFEFLQERLAEKWYLSSKDFQNSPTGHWWAADQKFTFQGHTVEINATHPEPPSAPQNAGDFRVNAVYDAAYMNQLLTTVSIPAPPNTATFAAIVEDQNNLGAASAKADRALFGQWVDSSGFNIATYRNGKMEIVFDPPVDGVGMYIRDLSTSSTNSGTQQVIVELHCVNGMVDVFNRSTNWETGTAQQDRRADTFYFHAHQDTCDAGARCEKLVLTNIVPEDSFGFDDMTLMTHGAKCDPGTLSGYVWNDQNDDANKDAGEAGIPGVTVILTNDGNCDPNTALQTTTTSNPVGFYQFTGVAVGEYRICELQSTVPGDYEDGQESLGTGAGGEIPAGSNDVFASVVIGELADQKNGENYNFGEKGRLPCVGNQPYCYTEATVGQPTQVTNVEQTLHGAQIKFGPPECVTP